MKRKVLKFIHLTTKQFIEVMASLLFILLLAVGTIIFVTEAIEDRQAEIAEWVGDKIAYPVEIGHIDIHWFGVIPKLRMEDVRIRHHDEGANLLYFKEARVGIDLLATLQKQEPVFSEITILGMNLALLRDETGRVQLEGFPIDNELADSSIDWTKLAIDLEKLSLEDVNLVLEDSVNAELSGIYEIEQLLLIREKANWSWNGSIILPDLLGDTLTMSGNLNLVETGFRDSQWDWQAKVNDLVLPALTREFALFGIGLERGRSDFEFEGKAVGWSINSAKATVDLSDFKLFSIVAKNQVKPVEIERFSGRFYWERQLGKWLLVGEELQLQINDDMWPTSSFSVKKNLEGVIQAEVSYIELIDVLSLALLSDEWPDDLHQQLVQQRPAGDIEALNIEYSPATGLQALSITVLDFSVSPWKEIPGVTGLSGLFDLRDQRASLNLNSREVSFYADAWLDEALFFDSISGLIRWEQTPQGWSVQSEALHVWNDDMTLQLDGTIQQQDGEIINDLRLTLQDVAVESWKKYVPSKILLPSFEEWAAPAFVTGLITKGEIVMRGPLSQFPYNKETDNGLFDLELHAIDFQLHYAPDWPDIQGVTGVITGNGNNLTIKSQFGTIADFEFDDVTVTIDDLVVGEGSILRVDSDIRGTTKQAITFLHNSPLKETFGAYTDSLLVSGNSDIHLELMVPLADPYATEATGSVFLKNASLQRKDLSDITVSEINGKLDFTNNGLSAKAIKAQLLGGPIQVDVKTGSGLEGMATTTKIDVYGQLQVKAAAKDLQQPSPDFISGQTSYELQIKLAEAQQAKQFNIDISLDSDLEGIKIDLPAPIGKISRSKVPLFLDLALLSDGAVDYSGYYGNALNTILEQKKNKWRGEIRLGKGKAVLPDAGVRLRGGLPHLELDAWNDIQMKPSDDGNSWTQSIDDVSLQFDLLTGFEQQIKNLSISAQRAADVWVVQLNSDKVAGKLHWPINFERIPLEANLKYLYIQTPDMEQDSGKKQLVRQELWPATAIQCDDFQIDDMKFGQVSLSSHRETNQWVMDSMTMTSPQLVLSATGSWRQSANKDSSQFDVKGNTDDLEAFLTSFGYQAGIESERAEMNFDLRWPGSPMDFSRGSTSGTVMLDIGTGRLSEVDPGAVGRVFGFLSIAMLPRVLSLDFTDLFGKGLGFDSITGSFDVHDGQAYTNNFVMKGPRADVEMKGRIGLVDHDYDQKIQIRPNLASTLPLAGGVVAGPIGLGVGAAIMIVDKVTGEVLGKNIINVVKYKYHMTGAWDNPDLERIRK